jgi:hypothetical protein
MPPDAVTTAEHALRQALVAIRTTPSLQSVFRDARAAHSFHARPTMRTVPNEITVPDGTEYECLACGKHTYLADDSPPPSTCWVCGNGPLRPSADLHLRIGEPIQKIPREP